MNLGLWGARRVGWRPAAGRVPGLLLGLGVAAIVDVLAVYFEILTGAGPFTTFLGLPVLVAGSAGGWFMGSLAWMARSRGKWIGVTIGLAILAVIIGSVTVSETYTIGAALQTTDLAPILAVPFGAMSAFGLAILGIVIVGPFALPFTLASSVVWSLLVWFVRRDAQRGAPA
jgi:hypothetical protein